MTDLIARGRSEHVQFRASECVLGASGIAPANQPQVSVNLELKAGWTIDLSGRKPRDDPPASKVIDGKPVE